MSTPAIDDQAFKTLQESIELACGLIVGDNQQYLIDQRLTPVMKEFNLTSWSELARQMRMHSNGEVAKRAVHEITTHETSFFRDRHPFETITEQILPLMCRQGRIQLSCLAASTGQEAYSLAMTCEEFKRNQPGANLQYSLYVTDISHEVVDKAKQGVYRKNEIARGMTPELIERYTTEGENNCRQFTAELRRHMQFSVLNLLDSLVTVPRTHLIMCRNVLIYFEKSVQERIIANLIDRLHHGGYLFLGATESAQTKDLPATRFSSGSSIYYCKDGA